MLCYDKDEDDKDSDWRLFFKKCNTKDLKKIMELDMKYSYDINDLNDKTNYFIHLPE